MSEAYWREQQLKTHRDREELRRHDRSPTPDYAKCPKCGWVICGQTILFKDRPSPSKDVCGCPGGPEGSVETACCDGLHLCERCYARRLDAQENLPEWAETAEDDR